MPKYRCGRLNSPTKKDIAFDDLQRAEWMAREMSRRLGGYPIAVWDERDTVVTLFVGFEQFKPV